MLVDLLTITFEGKNVFNWYSQAKVETLAVYVDDARFFDTLSFRLSRHCEFMHKNDGTK